MKIPFDIMYPIAESYYVQMALAKDYIIYSYYSDLYYAYIRACGWTDEELDKHLLIYVDNNWEEVLN